VNAAATSIPPSVKSARSWILRAKVSAIQIAATPAGARLGQIVQLLPGSRLYLSGEGFNERTVKVRHKISFYFVFIDDLKRAESLGNNVAER
jgi:hypothetical protein